MLLLLAEYLQQFHKGFAVFQYLSLRGILGVLTALVLSLWMGPWLIRTSSCARSARRCVPTDRSRICRNPARPPWVVR